MSAVFDDRRAWTLSPAVSLRPESFGALAYDFQTRRLSFLKHPTLVRVVEALADHETAAAACAAQGVTSEQRSAFTRALCRLADTGMIVERSA